MRQDRKAVATIATTTAFLIFEGVSEESEDDEHFLSNAVGVITGPVQQRWVGTQREARAGCWKQEYKVIKCLQPLDFVSLNKGN